MPCLLIAVLVLLGRLIAPASAMPDPANPVAAITLQSICHAASGGGTDGAPAQSPAEHQCLVCPACHLVAHASIPMPGGPELQPPTTMPVGTAALIPPATGPRIRARAVAQPTGPPTASV